MTPTTRPARASQRLPAEVSQPPAAPDPADRRVAILDPTCSPTRSGDRDGSALNVSPEGGFRHGLFLSRRRFLRPATAVMVVRRRSARRQAAVQESNPALTVARRGLCPAPLLYDALRRPLSGLAGDRMARMARRRQLYEGKAKVLFEGPEPGTLRTILQGRRVISPGRHQEAASITGKGVLNNRISEYLMMRLAEIGVPTHFVRRLNMREQLIREVEIIPLELVVRNVAAGSSIDPAGHPRGHPAAAQSIIEYNYKNDALNRSHGQRRSTSPPSAGPAPQDLDDMVSAGACG